MFGSGTTIAVRGHPQGVKENSVATCLPAVLLREDPSVPSAMSIVEYSQRVPQPVFFEVTRSGEPVNAKKIGTKALEC